MIEVHVIISSLGLSHKPTLHFVLVEGLWKIKSAVSPALASNYLLGARLGWSDSIIRIAVVNVKFVNTNS